MNQPVTNLNTAFVHAIVAAEHARFTLGAWRETAVDVWESSDAGSEIMAVIDGVPGVARLKLEARRAVIPPSRNYPSLGATIAGAAQAALAACCKSDRVSFVVAAPNQSGGMARNFSSLARASREAAWVVALDGRHLREACVAGHELGAEVGRYVARRGLVRR